MYKRILFATSSSLFCFVSLSCGTSSTSKCSVASYSTTSNSTLGLASQSDRGLSVAQSFALTTAGTPTTAILYLSKVGTFTQGSQTLQVTIEGNTAGSPNTPNNTAVMTSNTVDPYLVGTTTGSYTFTFSNASSLSTGTIYWLRLHASYAVNTTNYINWVAYDGATGGYQVSGTSYPSIYETNASSFSQTDIGTYLYLLFKITC